MTTEVIPRSHVSPRLRIKYIHLHVDPEIQVGQRIDAGDRLGAYSAAVGASGGFPHLHVQFEPIDWRGELNDNCNSYSYINPLAPPDPGSTSCINCIFDALWTPENGGDYPPHIRNINAGGYNVENRIMWENLD